MKRLSLLLTLVMMAGFGPAHATTDATTILIIRHGEKPAAGLGQLSCRGLNRSLALPEVLIRRYGAPTALYAPNPAIQKADSTALAVMTWSGLRS